MSTQLEYLQPLPPDAPIWARQWYAALSDLMTTAQRVASGATGDRPAGAATGRMFFDSTLGQPVWWDGAQWVDATGTPA